MTRYVPVLKAREAEIKALLKTPPEFNVTPLFELQRSQRPSVDRETGQSRRGQSTLTSSSYFLDDVARLWDGPLYIDISRVAVSSARAQWWGLVATLNTMAETPAQLMPVILPDSSDAELKAAAAVCGPTGTLAVRVPMVLAAADAAALTGVMRQVSTGALLWEQQVDVVLDWGDATERLALDTLVAQTAAAVSALGDERGRIITTGTPNSAAFQRVGDWHVSRREWWLWLRLVEAGVDVDFSDYALYPPADPAPVQPQYGHLRYSHDDVLSVHRRARPPGGGGLAQAFRGCCAHVVSQPYWLGSTFSGGDSRIEAIALDHDKESDAGKWRQIATEHHFAVVADQLTRRPTSPPPGTP